jgi:Glycosyl-hydrolase family 116, catalytic region
MMTRKLFLQSIAALASPAANALTLANESFHVTVAAGSQGVWVDRFAPGTLGSLVFGNAAEGMLRSGTALLPRGGEWHFARLPQSGSAVANGSFICVDGIVLGPESAPIARENWELTLAGDLLTWRIVRVWLRDIVLTADRFPALVFRTVERGQFLQIPGFLDTGMVLDGAKMFPLHSLGAAQYEALSDRRAQTIRLAPSGLALESKLESGLFSYAKPFSDGTSPVVAIGAECVDRARGPEARQAGTRQTQVWTLRLSRTPETLFELEIPDRLLAEQSRSFAAVHDQWMGWLFGNNPASVPVLQELAWFPMIQGIYRQNPATLEALEKEILFFADYGIQPDGFVMPRWGAQGFYRAPWGNLIDQIPQFILAMYFHALNTGSRDFVRRVLPAAERVARYMLALDRDQDGVFEIPGSSGLADGGRHCSGWFDIVNFGHKDALINVWCVAALEALAELAAFVGDDAMASRYRAAHALSREAYNRVFWDNDRALYMDWIDVREKMPGSGRRYFYTDHNMLAIIFGIAGRPRALRILAHLDRRYDELCRQFKLKRHAIWATPANMYPVTKLGDLVDFGELQNQKVYPNYENGCSFFHSTGFEIAARGAAGQVDAAYDTFERVMRHGYARNRLWAAGLKWDTGQLISEPLNNALLILWGFTRGCLGLRPSLTGLGVEGTCAQRMEGSSHTFCHLGRDVTVRVKGGRPVIT